MTGDILDRIRGWCCPRNIKSPRPFARLISGPTWDRDGRQRGQRINGCVECPRCGLMWPLIEELEAWTQAFDGRWHGAEWGLGTAECLECGAVFVGTFEGVTELRSR